MECRQELLQTKVTSICNIIDYSTSPGFSALKNFNNSAFYSYHNSLPMRFARRKVVNDQTEDRYNLTCCTTGSLAKGADPREVHALQDDKDPLLQFIIFKNQCFRDAAPCPCRLAPTLASSTG